MYRVLRRIVLGTVAFLLPLMSLNAIGTAVFASPSMIEYSVPSASATGGANISNMVEGGGKFWFAQPADNDIGSITSDGVVQTYQGLDPSTHPVQVAPGLDGTTAVWFTQAPNDASLGYGQLGRITSTGNVEQYRLNAPYDTSSGIITTSGVSVAFTEWGPQGAAIGIMSLSTHQITDYPLSNPDSRPSQITYGNGYWFTDPGTNSIGLFNFGQPITEYPIPTPGAEPAGLTVAGGPGGVWFTERATGKVGRIALSGGTITEYPIPTPGAEPIGITAGAGSVWFTEHATGKIGRITNGGGTITEYPIPTPASGPVGITVSSALDGVWFTEAGTSGPTLHDGVGLIPNTALPAAPTVTTPSTPTGSYPVLNWNAVDGVTSYNIYNASDDSLITTVGANITTFTDTSAQRGPHYYYVTTLNGGDESFPSNVVKIIYSPVAAPANLTASSPDRYPALSWTGATGATFYKIYRNGTLIDTISSNNTNYTDYSASPGDTDVYYVTAMSSGGESGPSNSVTVMVIDSAAAVGSISMPSTLAKGASFSASAQFTYEDSSDTHTAIWNWGDGSSTTGTVSESNESGSVTGGHAYTTAGSYTVTISVTNSYGYTGTSQFVVAVSPKTTNTFTKANLSGLNFSNADLSGLNISGSNLQNGIFNSTNFSGSNLSGSNAPHASFQGANFTNANLAGSTFQAANFTGADFTGAYLKGANFKDAIMTNVTWSNTTCPDGTNSDTHAMTCIGHGGGL
jgi:virginiamycin B lyase